MASKCHQPQPLRHREQGGEDCATQDVFVESVLHAHLPTDCNLLKASVVAIQLDYLRWVHADRFGLSALKGLDSRIRGDKIVKLGIESSPCL